MPSGPRLRNPPKNVNGGGMKRESVIEKRRAAAESDPAAYAAKRREIAEAAVRVFDRMGFQRASISAVAQEMKTDRSNLYYYINSKEELFDEVVRTVVERNLELV